MISAVAAPHLSRLARDAWPAIAIWALATATVLITAVAAGYSPFSPSTWSRWDSGLYLDIARHGYTLFRCAPPNGSQWCGNAGWFPAYPWLLRALTTTGVPLAPTALGLSWFFSAATLVLLRLTFLRERLSLGIWACLAYATFAPGQVFFYAVSPISMLTCFLVIHLWLLSRGRWVAAGVAGAVAALAHPVGVMVVPAAAIWLLATTRGEPIRERGRRVALVAGLSLVGPAAMTADQAVEVGHANAYLLVQGKYGHGIHDPFGPVVNGIYSVARTSPFALAAAPAVQTLFVAFVLACVLVELVLRRRTATRTDWLLANWAIVTWVIPHMEANVSWSRSEAALALLAALARRLPLPLLAVFLAVAIWLTVAMTQLFLRGDLV
jgi:hypothetical protein